MNVLNFIDVFFNEFYLKLWSDKKAKNILYLLKLKLGLLLLVCDIVLIPTPPFHTSVLPDC
ncbi:hypothetical protein BpHYR1_039549 [Brachionus plicatilis]|uniref:Uncharacterized protein n=1 Tax=Brachionus plicatilis TaxID=10195 RepID=A0A3M7QUV0_BRAPC|nr:hypothetical protein BpHYR1_039549 [Brachionus plicatilis]